MSHTPDETQAGEHTRPASPLLRTIILAMLPFILLGAALAGFQFLKRFDHPPPQRLPQAAAPLVETVMLKARDVTLDVEGYGTVRPKEQFALAPQVAGVIVRIAENFEVGRLVEKDQVLVEIDPTNYRLALQTAKAALAEAQAEAERLAMQQQNLERELEVQRERIAVLHSEAERMQRAWEDSPDAVSVNERDRALATLLAERTQMSVRESSLKVMPATLERARADVQRQQAGVELAEVNLERTRIRTPITGRVIQRAAENGQFVTTFPATGVGIVADHLRFEVPVPLEPAVLRNLPPMSNQPPNGSPSPEPRLPPQAFVRWDAWAGAEGRPPEWTGKVTRAETVNETTRLLPLIVEVELPAAIAERDDGFPALVQGAHVKVRIEGQRLSDAIVIPERALHEGRKVHLLRDGQLEIREVAVRHRLGGELVLDAGLKPGEKLVLTPLPFPVDGMALREAGSGHD